MTNFRRPMYSDPFAANRENRDSLRRAADQRRIERERKEQLAAQRDMQRRAQRQRPSYGPAPVSRPAVADKQAEDARKLRFMQAASQIGAPNQIEQQGARLAGQNQAQVARDQQQALLQQELAAKQNIAQMDADARMFGSEAQMMGQLGASGMDAQARMRAAQEDAMARQYAAEQGLLGEQARAEASMYGADAQSQAQQYAAQQEAESRLGVAQYDADARMMAAEQAAMADMHAADQTLASWTATAQGNRDIAAMEQQGRIEQALIGADADIAQRRMALGDARDARSMEMMEKEMAREHQISQARDFANAAKRQAAKKGFSTVEQDMIYDNAFQQGMDMPAMKGLMPMSPQERAMFEMEQKRAEFELEAMRADEQRKAKDYELKSAKEMLEMANPAEEDKYADLTKLAKVLGSFGREPDEGEPDPFGVQRQRVREILARRLEELEQ